MNNKTIIVNIFSASETERKCSAWELALELTKSGLKVECLPDNFEKSVKEMQLDMLENLLNKQVTRIDELKESVEIIINGNPLLLWKLNLQTQDKEFCNMVDDAILLYDNFNIYLKREKEDINDLKMKGLLVPDEIYGIYERKNMPIIAANIAKTYKRICQPDSKMAISLAKQGYQNYKALKKILFRYSEEVSGTQDVVNMLMERNIAKVSKTNEGGYKINYKNISVIYKKCGSIDVGILSNNYCVYEQEKEQKGRHRYDFNQQTDFLKQVKIRNYTQER